MKKLNYLFGAALVAFATTMVSCSDFDNPAVTGIGSVDGPTLATVIKGGGNVVLDNISSNTEITLTGPVTAGEDLNIIGNPGAPAKINFAKGATITTTSSIKMSNVIIDASDLGAPLIAIGTPSTKALKADGTESKYGVIKNITFENVIIKGLANSLIKGKDNVLFKKILVNNSIIEIVGNNTIFALANGYPADLQIVKSTIWSKEGHEGYLFQSHGKAPDINSNYKTSWSIDQSTLYQIAVGKKMNNSNTFKGKPYFVINLSNSILDNVGSNEGNEVNGWLFGQNFDSENISYSNNTYSNDGEIVAGWTNAEKKGSDQTGTAGTVVPKFADAANGDFTQAETNAGDPRWIK